MAEGSSIELGPNVGAGPEVVHHEALFQPARDIFFNQLLEMKRKLEYDVKEANTELKVANRKRVDLGCELKLQQDILKDIIQRRQTVQAQRDHVRCKQAAADADAKRMQSELGKERELTSRKRQRHQDLESQLKKLMMAVHECDMQQASQAAQVGIAKRAGLAREQAQRSTKHVGGQEVLLQLLRSRLEKTKQATSELKISSEHLQKVITERRVHAREIERAREAVDTEAVAIGRRWEQALAQVSKADAELDTIELLCVQQRSKVLSSSYVLRGVREEAQECGKRSLALSSRIRHLETRKHSLILDLAASHEKKSSIETDIGALGEKQSNVVARCEAKMAALTRAEHDAKDLHAERCRLEAVCQQSQKHIEDLLMRRAESGRGGEASLLEMRDVQKAIAVEELSIQELRPQIDELRGKADWEAARAQGLEIQLQAAEAAVNVVSNRFKNSQKEVKDLLRAIEGRTREEQAANRELHRLGCAGEDSAPLQNEIYNLASEVSKKQKAILLLKRDWGELQTQFLAAHRRNSELAGKERAEYKMLASLEQQKEAFAAEERETEAKLALLEKELRAVASKCNRIDAVASQSQDRRDNLEKTKLASATVAILSLHQECKGREEQLESVLVERDRFLKLVAQVRGQVAAATNVPSRDTETKRKNEKENRLVKQARDQVAQLERQLAAAQRRRSKAAVALEQATRAHGAALERAHVADRLGMEHVHAEQQQSVVAELQRSINAAEHDISVAKSRNVQLRAAASAASDKAAEIESVCCALQLEGQSLDKNIASVSSPKNHLILEKAVGHRQARNL